jgi:hypothetical protein
MGAESGRTDGWKSERKSDSVTGTANNKTQQPPNTRPKGMVLKSIHPGHNICICRDLIRTRSGHGESPTE